MSSSAQALEAASEAEFLEQLRTQYVEQGFSFKIWPRQADLPDFLASYQPDAIAQKPGTNIAIEVKGRPGLAKGRSLRDIRDLFDGHPDWHFTVAYTGNQPSRPVEFQTAQPATVWKRMDEVAALSAQGHRRAAFVMAWSLLESAGQSNAPTAPGPATESFIQRLAMLGVVEPEAEQRLRSLAQLRNQVVHGDLDAEPTPDDVAQVASIAERVLTGSDDAAANGRTAYRPL